MADTRMACMQMGMSGRMLSNIGRDLWNDLPSMSVVSLGMMKGKSSHHHLALRQSDTFLSSSSHMMNPHSTKTTNVKSIGAAQARM